ncbi:hypothetical protein L6452_30479 [Arctium lappa]|uniref:Uncharacterized protein n=1 Tax=Arctium lappa TaxID=4217 RepID=A0ACB8ZHL3_ARCLA|nr:hypothetical protein L6452_30479 [Arctium lappa]
MMHPNRDDGNSVPPANDDVEVVEIYNHSMPVEVPVDSTTETEGERSGNEGKLENQPIPMNGVVDSSTVTEDLKMNDNECIDEDKSGNTKSTIMKLGTDESKTLHKGKKRKGVESLMTYLKMNDSECKDKSGPTKMKECKKTVDSIRGSPSWLKNTKDDCFQVDSSSRVTRSQRRKQLEEERSRKEPGVQPPNMGAHDATPKHASRSVSQRVVVDKNGPPITVWNKKSLKRRERTELEDGGFGFLPLLNIHHTRNLDGKSSTEKRAKSSGIKGDHEATEQDLLNKIMDKMASLKRLKEEAEGEIQHGMTNFPNKDKFVSLQRELDSLFQSSSPSGGKTPNTTRKTGLVNECMNIVLSQQVDDPMKQLWDSPTYVQQVYESMHVSVENSKAMKFLRDIEPPGFDLGISPVKDVQQEHAPVAGASGSWRATNKGKGKLFTDEQASDVDVVNQGVTQSRISASVANVAASDSCEQRLEENNIKNFIAPKKEEHDSISDNPIITDNHRNVDNITRARPLRRNVKPGDPLKSPYVVRILDFNVSAEDKRAHEWALSILGRKVDAGFRSNDCVNILCTGLETLAATNMNVSPSVIAGWASILNYEERFRNKDSIRRYFFSIEMMADPLLRMRSVDEKTQYAIFRSNLEATARHWPNLMKMKDIDLTAMKKEIERFTSMDPDIKLQILRQAYETRFERLEF